MVQNTWYHFGRKEPLVLTSKKMQSLNFLLATFFKLPTRNGLVFSNQPMAIPRRRHLRRLPGSLGPRRPQRTCHAAHGRARAARTSQASGFGGATNAGGRLWGADMCCFMLFLFFWGGGIIVCFICFCFLMFFIFSLFVSFCCFSCCLFFLLVFLFRFHFMMVIYYVRLCSVFVLCCFICCSPPLLLLLLLLVCSSHLLVLLLFCSSPWLLLLLFLLLWLLLAVLLTSCSWNGCWTCALIVILRHPNSWANSLQISSKQNTFKNKNNKEQIIVSSPQFKPAQNLRKNYYTPPEIYPILSQGSKLGSVILRQGLPAQKLMFFGWPYVPNLPKHPAA